MKKFIGLVVLSVGIAITAGTGSQLSPEFRVEMAKTGQARFATDRSERRHKKYCQARKAAGLKAAEGCENAQGKVVPLLKPARLKGITEYKRTGRMIQALNTLQPRLPKRVAKRRAAWIKALQKERTAHKRVAKQGTQGPGARLSGWWSQAGFGFGLGLLLVVSGAWICRVAMREQLLGSGGSSKDGPTDFGVLLEDVVARVAALHGEMVALETPTFDDLDALKARLEEIQKGDLARLCESGPKVQQRYGLTGFAEIFSPLSAGERKLNRLWATLVDRHWPEALRSANGAVLDLKDAVVALKQHAPA